MHSSGNPLILVVVIVIVVAVLAAVIVSAIRRREEVFEGVVVDKDVHENVQQNTPMNQQPGTISFGNNAGVTHSYYVKVQTDNGKVINYRTTQGMYETLKIGDRVSKPKGTTTLTVVAAAPASQTAQPAQEPPADTPPTDTSTPPSAVS